MGYSIWYDRRFIKVGEKIIPIVQAGSNNCWQNNWSGRMIPEKNWQVLSYPHRNKNLFTVEELTELYKSEYYDDKYAHKSRNSHHKDFRRWLLSGIKSAKTIEEATALGNTLTLSFCDDKGFHSFDIESDEELLTLMTKYHDKEVNIGYRNRDYRAEKKTYQKREKDYSKGYYVINVGYNHYLYKMKKHGYSYSRWMTSCKKFLTEAEGRRYLRKYENKLKNCILEFVPPSTL